ncbi:MAG: aconitase X catalytic domain-containing protein [Sulfolobales archaeon]
MYLNREEERMLSGEMGEAVAKAINVIVKVGEALGAPRLIEVSHAHVSGVSYFNIGDFGLEFIEDLLASKARFSIFTTANPHAALLSYRSRGFDNWVVDKQLKIVDALRQMGVKSFTCTPYYVRKPSHGEHLAWAESSAVLYANSVLGAMTNRETGIVALLSGITGRTYLGEAHIGLPREVRYVVEIEKPRDPSEAGAYGLLVGESLKNSIPLVNGLEDYPEYYLKEFLAAFATGSPTYLAVLHGVTPGYREVDTTSAERLVFSKSDILKLYSEIKGCNSPLYLLGCPHLSFEELTDILGKIEGVRRGELWLTVGEHYGRVVNIESRRNIKISPGGCAVTTRLDLLGVDCVITDSAKALTYLPKLAGVRAFLVRRSELLKMVASVD